MPGDGKTIHCGQHGEAYEAFVCEHLAEQPRQEWFSAFPEEDDPWPDAWCAKCNAAFEREGEWNDRNKGDVSIKLICDRCYEQGRGESTELLKGKPLEAWNAFVASCCAELEEKQRRFVEEFELDRHTRWDWDQAESLLVFSNDGVPAVNASIEFVGSVSNRSNTWLWSWANFSLHENVRTRIIGVRDLGEERRFPHLVTPKWNATEHDGWHMTAIAVHVLGAIGAYRGPTDNGATFLAVMSAEEA